MREVTSIDSADLLDAAADELLVRGWTKGIREEVRRGAVCLVGAVMAASTGSPWGQVFSTPAVDAALKCLPQSIGHYPRCVSWNDAYGRTEDEVHDALRSAAKKLREVDS